MATNGEIERVALLQTDRAGAGSTRTSYEVEAASRNLLPTGKLDPEQESLVQKLKRGLIAFLFFCAAIAGVTLIYFGERRIRLQYGTLDYCMDPACIHASSAILTNLSPKKIDPCENFDEFVCGGWAATHDLQPDQGDIFEGTMMAERSRQILRHVLEGTYEDLKFSGLSKEAIASLKTSKVSKEDEFDRQNFEKLQTLYKTCLDEKEIEARGVKPILPLFEKLEATLKDDAKFVTDAITYVNEVGTTALIGFSIGADDRNPDTIVMNVGDPRRIGLPSKQYYKDEKIVALYIKTIDAMFKNMAEALTTPGIKREGAKVFEFEKRLSEATMNPEDSNDITKTYNPFSLKEVSAMLPQFDFEHFFKTYTPEHVPQRLIVSSPSYLKTVSQILKETDPGIVKAYIEWKMIQDFNRHLPKSVTKPIRTLIQTLKGTTSEEERWKTCVREADDQLGWFLGRFFIQKAFSEAAKQLGDRIIMDIKEQFTYTLNHLDWVSDEVRKLATEKVHNIVQKVGFPDKGLNITDPAKLHDFYSDVEVKDKLYFENALSVRKHDLKREWSKLGKPTDRTEWYMTPPTVNAYYSPPGNEIVFPAGIMQFPVFGELLPEYLSYGAFGSVAGHELSHAFDSLGRHYDLHGNYTDWWDNSTVAAFESRAECFVQQFSEYSVEGPDGKPLHVNGRLTLGENIADAGGVNAAFDAWRKREKRNPNKHLPGLDRFTKEQLFFVSYGNWWCSKSRKEAAINRIRVDPHSPKFARILGTMANSPAFLEAFKCPAKKPRCKLW